MKNTTFLKITSKQKSLIQVSIQMLYSAHLREKSLLQVLLKSRQASSHYKAPGSHTDLNEMIWIQTTGSKSKVMFSPIIEGYSAQTNSQKNLVFPFKKIIL